MRVAEEERPMQIGLVGLGTIGRGLVGCLVDAGQDVLVHDIDPKAVRSAVRRGGSAADGPTALARQSSVVLLSLPGPSTVEEVVIGEGGIGPALPEGGMLVDTSTSEPRTTERLAAALEPRDIVVVGAPVSGGAANARAGTLTAMVGCTQSAFEACEPLLTTIASDVVHVGTSPGDGHAVKLLNNFLSTTALLATSEALAVGGETRARSPGDAGRFQRGLRTQQRHGP